MEYQKPEIIDLRTQTALGYEPACMPGAVVATPGCAAGDNAAACQAGTGGFIFSQDCVPGNNPVAGYSCLSGTNAGFECAGGSTPVHAGTCTTGPSN